MSAAARLVLVVGASGGCGASTLAAALALSWQRDGEGAWLVEADAGRGDVAAAWDLAGERTLADLHGVVDELGPGHVRAAAEEHPSGVRVLAAAADPSAAGWADPPAGERLARAVAEAAGPSGRCAIDGGPGAGSLARGVAQVATAVLVVCPPRLDSARRARSVASALAAPGTGLVVAAGGRAELGTRALARATGLEVRGTLPWSPGEAAELGCGRWPRRRRRSLRAEAERLAAECGP